MLYISFISKVLKVDESFYTILMIIESIGLLIGSFMVTKRNKKVGFMTIISYLSLIDGICILIHYFINDIWLFLIVGLITGILNSIISVFSITALQKSTNNEYRSREIGSYQMLLGVVSIPGLFIGGSINSELTIRLIFAICGLLIIAISFNYIIKGNQYLKTIEKT